MTTAKDRNHRLDRMARFEGESGGEKKEEEDEALMLMFPVACGGVLSLRLLRIIRGPLGPVPLGLRVVTYGALLPHGRTKHRVGILAVFSYVDGGFFVAKVLLFAVMLEMRFCCFLVMMNCV